MEHEKARRVNAMKPEERIGWALEYIGKVYPELDENVEGGTSFSWDDEPWSLGAWAYYAPGEMATMFPNVVTPEGRIHFAGEHTATNMTVEGAVQSGMRAAREVASASGSPV
jgi:monoamine oxidase